MDLRRSYPTRSLVRSPTRAMSIKNGAPRSSTDLLVGDLSEIGCWVALFPQIIISSSGSQRQPVQPH
jgi:hypothetical protein